MYLYGVSSHFYIGGQGYGIYSGRLIGGNEGDRLSASACIIFQKLKEERGLLNVDVVLEKKGEEIHKSKFLRFREFPLPGRFYLLV